MPRPVHFELPAADPERAARFYTDVFGWTIEKWEGPVEYWLVTTGEEDEPGINGGIMRPQGPEATTVNTVGVDDLDRPWSGRRPPVRRSWRRGWPSLAWAGSPTSPTPRATPSA